MFSFFISIQVDKVCGYKLTRTPLTLASGSTVIRIEWHWEDAPQWSIILIPIIRSLHTSNANFNRANERVYNSISAFLLTLSLCPCHQVCPITLPLPLISVRGAIMYIASCRGCVCVWPSWCICVSLSLTFKCYCLLFVTKSETRWRDKLRVSLNSSLSLTCCCFKNQRRTNYEAEGEMKLDLVEMWNETFD